MSRGAEEAAIVLEIDAENGSARIIEGLQEARRLLGPIKRETIHALEALYLLYTGRARARHSGREVGFEEAVCLYSLNNPYMWVEFEVYMDLRRRGRHPEPGPRPHTLLLRRKKHEKRYTRYVLVLEENRPINTSTLVSFIEESFSNGWEPLLAIVDRYGDITYYETLLFRPREGRIEGR